ncbi:MAG: adenosylhomocysteinase [Geminicoccaceae bacterium]
MSEQLVERGRAALACAFDEMPVLAAIRDEVGETRPLAGATIAGCLHLTKETGVLIELLHDAGAEIAWTGGDEVSTQNDVAAALREGGVAVYGRRGMTTEQVNAEIVRTLAHHADGPTIIIDNGARLIRGALDDLDRYPALSFATEKTTEGCADLRLIARNRELPFPIFLVNDVVTKWEMDNTYGTGQSALDGILRATGKLIAGKAFVVCGYGHVGRGVAMRAAGQGARVIVCCRSAATAVRATLDGFHVLSLEQAIAQADFLCTATGKPEIVKAEHLAFAKDGAILCNAGYSVTEIDVSGLEAMAVESTEITDLVRRYVLADGRRINLIGRGGLVNLAAATGNPSEVMDVTFANQVLAVLAGAKMPSLKPGLHEVSEEQDECVALRKLAAMGVRCDAPGFQKRKGA